MKYCYMRIWLMLFIMIALPGCSSKVDRLPGIDVKPDQINTDFVIYEDPVGGSANTHKNHDVLAIDVKNLGNSQIVFSPGYIRLFAKTEAGWVEIEDLMEQPEVEERLPTFMEFPPGMVVTLIPWIPDMTEPTNIRIFFAGQNVNTDKKVGAYLDLTLLP